MTPLCCSELKLGHFWGIIGVVCPSVLAVINLTHRPVVLKKPRGCYGYGISHNPAQCLRSEVTRVCDADAAETNTSRRWLALTVMDGRRRTEG